MLINFLGIQILFLITNAAKGVIAVLIIGLIVLSIRYLLKTLFIPNRKEYLFKEAISIYKGKLNFFGNPEIQIQNWKVLIEYDYENGHEYIIALIDISHLENTDRKKLKSEFDIVEKDNKIHIKIYSSWGYQGKKFQNRLLKKIELLNKKLLEIDSTHSSPKLS